MAITLDQEAVDYLAMQRPSYRNLSPEDAGTRLKEQIDAFLMRASWLSNLPKRPLRVLDIGAGIGFGTLALHRHLGDGEFHILDKTETTPKLYYGFEEVPSAYNNLEVTRRVLSDAGIGNLYIHDASKPGSFPAGLFDLIMGHISWGFHFPVSIYFDQVVAATNPGAMAFMDLRNDTGGEETMQRAFDLVWSKPGSKSIATAWVRR